VNFALPALVVFVVLFPGFLFRSRFKRIERTSLDYSPFGQVVTEGIAWSAVFHAVWLAAAYWWQGQRLRTDVLFGLLSSDATAQAAAVRHIQATDLWVVIYFGSLFLCCWAFGTGARSLIVRFGLDRADRRFAPLFRFGQAPWYYLLTAAELPEVEKPDLIIASALVEIGKEAFLYSGVVEHYYFDDEGNLDRLVLSDAARRPFSADKESPDQGRAGRFYSIDGNFFVLRLSEAVTLNIQYVKFEDVMDAMTLQGSAEEQ
jgi:hypothetical protein